MTLITPRANPWCKRVSADPMGSPVRLSAEAASAGQSEPDGSNKAEAACQVKASSKPTSVPMLGMLFPKLPFLVGTSVLLGRSQNFWGNEREMDPRQTTCENKILFYQTSTYVVRNMPSTNVLRNESERIILLIV